MQLFLVRHGESVHKDEWKGEEGQRPLTAEGAALIRREAAALARLEPGVSRILASPLARALQTARCLADALGLPGSPDDRLAPGFDVAALRSLLGEHRGPGALLLVGHEPDFSRIIAACAGGARVELKTGGVACLDITDLQGPRGSLLWLIPCRVLAP